MRFVLLLAAAFVAAPLSAQSLVFDSDFGVGGVVELAPETPTGAYALTALSGGDVVLGGRLENDGALVRLNASGALVPSFGDGGIVRFNTNAGASAVHFPVDVIESADGHVLAAGTVATPNGSVSTGFVTRLTSAGAMDTAFGTDGFVTFSTNIGYARTEIIAVGELTDGSLIAVGSGRATSGSAAMPFAVRLSEDGELDTSYGSDSDGVAPVELAASVINALVLPDGQVYISGSVATGEAVLLRLTAEGELDSTFGDDGIVRLDLTDVRDYFFRLALDSQGRIVVAVSAVGEGTSQGYVARYTADGALDTSFDSDGYAQVTSDGGASSVLVRADGSILVVGSTAVGDEYQGLVASFRGDGTLDAGFGTGGTLTVGADRDNIALEGVLAGSDVVVAGYYGNTPNENGMLAFRLTPTGTAVEPVAAESGLALRYGGVHPMQGSVRLAIAVDQPTSLRVDLVDLHGRVVARVHDGPLAEGSHTLALVSDLPAGMYIAHAVADDGRTARLPVVVVR